MKDVPYAEELRAKALELAIKSYGEAGVPSSSLTFRLEDRADKFLKYLEEGTFN